MRELVNQVTSPRVSSIGKGKADPQVSCLRPATSRRMVLSSLVTLSAWTCGALTVACHVSQQPRLLRSPANAVQLKSVLAPADYLYSVLITAESARFTLPVPRRPEWRWDVTPWQTRPGAEYLFEVQWDTLGRSAQELGRYIEVIEGRIDEPPLRTPSSGNLADLVAATKLLVGPGNERGTSGSPPTVPVLRARADTTAVVFLLGPSDQLTRLRRLHPDSFATLMILTPLGISYRRTVGARYR